MTLATFYSCRALPGVGTVARCVAAWYLLLFLGFPGRVGAAVATEDFAKLALDRYLASGARLETNRGDVGTAWRHAKACFDWAEFATNSPARARVAGEGIEAARAAVARDSHSAESRYYLAMNLGQLARTKSLGALKLVREMEREFKAAIELDERVDHGGAHRCLGTLYRDAPGWPASVGDKAAARRHLEAAVQLFPEHPENLLRLAESCSKWDDTATAQSMVVTLQALLPKVEVRYQGEEWLEQWLGWKERLAVLAAGGGTKKRPAMHGPE